MRKLILLLIVLLLSGCAPATRAWWADNVFYGRICTSPINSGRNLCDKKQPLRRPVYIPPGTYKVYVDGVAMGTHTQR